eukprot:7455029-Pyramimonas_sp.AAC.1
MRSWEAVLPTNSKRYHSDGVRAHRRAHTHTHSSSSSSSLGALTNVLYKLSSILISMISKG